MAAPLNPQFPIPSVNELTLSVVSHGHGPLLDRLLRELASQSSLANVRTIVTLNLAGERFDATAYAPLDVVVLRNPKPRGFGANHNAAFAHCRTAWFGILNPDLSLCEQEPFTALLAGVAAMPDVGLVAPQVVNEDRVPEDAVRANLTPWSLLGRHLGRRRRPPLLVDGPARKGAGFFWLAGMCLLVSSGAFRRVGGFDERFFLYCEDYDLCARLYNAGYALALDRSVQIVHTAQRDSHRSPRHMRWHVSSLFKVWASAAFWRITLTSPRPRPEG